MWDAFKDIIFEIIQFFYTPFHDWGMSIIVVTVIFRVCISPLMHKQTKSSYQMQKIQPKIKEIQERYADDKFKLQEEMQRIYAEAKFNPLSGCLPILLQMPIFIALFQVLREMGSRIDENVYCFYNLVPDLVMTPSGAFAISMRTFIPYIILLIIFAGATFLPLVLQQMGNKENPQRTQTLVMAAFMSLFMLWIGWGSPAGVLLFWGTSSIIGVGQQQISMRIMKRRDEIEEAQKEDEPVQIDVVRKVQKKRPTKKS